YGYRGDARHFVLWWLGIHPFPRLVLGEGNPQQPGYRATPRLVCHVATELRSVAVEGFVGKAGGALRTGTVVGRRPPSVDPRKVRKLLGKFPLTVLLEAMHSVFAAGGVQLTGEVWELLGKLVLPFCLWFWGQKPSSLGYDPVYWAN